MKRCFCVLLAGLLLLSLCGCETSAPDESSVPVTQAPVTQPETVVTGYITLPYNADASLDPFTTDSRINLELTALLYESPVVLDDTWTPRPGLAASFAAEGVTLTVTLREGAVFSDNSPVTANDVVYSFNRAAGSAHYKALLADFAACRAADERTAVFTLRRALPDAAGCLTFPVVKTPVKGSADLPLGSGRYVLVREGGTAALHISPLAAAGAVQQEIGLYPVAREDMLLHALESGCISYYFDTLSEGTLPRSVKAGLAADLLYLVFVGINPHTVSNVYVRQALSAAADRTALAAAAYKGFARPAVTPFHPLYKPTAGQYTFSPVAAVSSAAALLSQVKNVPALELIYPADNDFKKAAAEAFAAQMAAAGITVTPVPLAYDTYLARLQSGNYSLYLGEVRLAQAGNLTPLFSGALQGTQGNGTAAAAYARYMDGTGSLDAFLTAFAADMPFVPLCYRQGQALFDRTIGAHAPLAGNVYYRLDQWTVS